ASSRAQAGVHPSGHQAREYLPDPERRREARRSRPGEDPRRQAGTDRSETLALRGDALLRLAPAGAPRTPSGYSKRHLLVGGDVLPHDHRARPLRWKESFRGPSKAHLGNSTGASTAESLDHAGGRDAGDEDVEEGARRALSNAVGALSRGGKN